MTAQDLSDRVERRVRYGEVASQSVYTEIDYLVDQMVERRITRLQPTPVAVQINTLRGLLRLCAREHIPLKHGMVKHARDLIRHLERST